MAAAVLAKFRCKSFSDPNSLQAFVVQVDSPVNTIVSITFADGSYTIFYMIA